MNPLAAQADFIAALSLDSTPPRVREAAKLCVLDTVGVAVGAGGDTQVRNVLEAFKAMEPGCREAGVWGGEEKLSVFRAAYINALMGHTLELDDVHVRSKTHIGTVVIPAAWAMAEKLGKSGRQFLEAVICGYEIMARIGMGFGVASHREKGWHVTATAGTFGAAAACAKLSGLSPEQTANALALAGAQSFGLWSFLEAGATNKPLHPAHAAMSGMEAAVLAEAGMTGPLVVLDAKDGGIYRAMSDACDIALTTEGLAERYELLNLDKKPYPCCRSAHCAIDGILRLRKEHGLRAETVERVVVKTYKVGYMQVGCSEPSRHPRLPSDAKFSTPYVVACALLDGGVGLEHFRPEGIERPDRVALLEKVTVEPDDAFTARYPTHWGCRVDVRTVSGEEYGVEIPDASGSVEAPMSAEEVMAKAVGTARMRVGDRAEKMLSGIMTIDTAATPGAALA